MVSSSAFATTGHSPHDRATFDRRLIRWGAVLFTATCALDFLHYWLDDLVRDHGGTWQVRLIEEATSTYSALILSIGILGLWRLRPITRSTAWRRFPLWLGATVAYSVLATTMRWGSRTVAFRAMGLGDYDYGHMPLRYLMEAQSDIRSVVILVVILALLDGMMAQKESERVHSELQHALTASQLQNLRMQLQPHFLFNALNTIAAKIYDAPAVADASLGKLADLLRASLRAADTPQVTIREEIALLNSYVDLMRTRFEDNLNVTISVASDAEDQLIPPLLIQPLVENAVRHGALTRDGAAVIAICVRKQHEHVSIEVHDDGPGVQNSEDPLSAGTGLSTTAHRLRLLHGSDATISARNAADGGFLVRITVPCTAIPAPR